MGNVAIYFTDGETEEFEDAEANLTDDVVTVLRDGVRSYYNWAHIYGWDVSGE